MRSAVLTNLLITKDKMTQKNKKNYADYVDFIKEHLNKIERDVFTGDLSYYNSGRKRWIPVLSDDSLGMLRSKARDSGGDYNPAAMEDHIYRLTYDSRPRLLIDVPQWDGEDRLKLIAGCLNAKNMSQEEIEYFIKDWGVKMFARMYDPIEQNRILILKGAQGLGKDHLIKQMLGALGQYFVPFTIQQQEKDTFELVSSGMCMHISEFDRTSRTEVATLKNIITTDRVKFRGAYERKSDFRILRASFIATCNVDEILRDPTGARRYVIIDLADSEHGGILWNYPQGHSAQILAQWKALAYDKESVWQRNAEFEGRLVEYLESQTPVNPEQEVCSDYERLCVENLFQDGKRKSSELNDVWTKLAKLHGYSVNYVRTIIKRNGYGVREMDGIYYRPTRILH